MTTFLGIELSKEEELFLTSVIVKLVCDDEPKKMTNEELFHRVLEMATCSDRAEVLLRELRKKVKQGRDVTAMHKGNENNITAYWAGFIACANMVKAMLSNKKYNYQFMQKDEKLGKYIPDMAKLKANASCKEEVDYLTEVENRWKEYRKKGHENLIGFNFNMCYVMKQACGHFEIFQTHAEDDADAIRWLGIVEEEATHRVCTRCVIG